ncbi:CLUMA_CG020062, isoform A [Clunio marinus]|uniref:CLUMA_CG020062, isoform A n=1 Tax=Clunio marinus TaxID=568069 RepID=A0A1J1J3Q7_9DIPT|nr:CLUMA_CG020062, isoform A [Clunio marinus]
MDDELTQSQMTQMDLEASRKHLQNLNLDSIQTVNILNENVVVPTASSSNNPQYNNNEPAVANKEEFDNILQILSNAVTNELRQLNIIAQNGCMETRVLMRSFINALEHVPLIKPMEQVQQRKEAREAINKKRRLE